MAGRNETEFLWRYILEHAMWVLALGLLLLASLFFQHEMPYPAFFTLFLMVVLLVPAVRAWNCIVALSCHDVSGLSPALCFIFVGLVLVWLIAPMALAAAVIEPRWRACNPPRDTGPGRAAGPNGIAERRGIILRVSVIAVTLSMFLSVIGGANSQFWARDLSLGDNLFINAAFVLPIALMPVAMVLLRRGLATTYRRLLARQRLNQVDG